MMMVTNPLLIGFSGVGVTSFECGSGYRPGAPRTGVRYAVYRTCHDVKNTLYPVCEIVWVKGFYPYDPWIQLGKGLNGCKPSLV